MGVSNAPTAKGKEAARGLKQATAQEERKELLLRGRRIFEMAREF